MAGDVVKFLWGMSKRHDRSIPLSEKITKEKFVPCDQEKYLHI